MRILIVNTDYGEFLNWLYAQHPGLEQQPYAEQMRVRNASLFGVADFYSRHLSRLGHETWDVHTNNQAMQKAWAQERGLRFAEPAPALDHGKDLLRDLKHRAAQTPARYLKRWVSPFLQLLDAPPGWFYQILKAQIEYYKPDVLLVQNMAAINVQFLREIKPLARLVMGQHAATPLAAQDYRCYDLIISLYPPTLDFFRARGIPAELSRAGFEPSVLSQIADTPKTFELTFIGSLGSVHDSRAQWLDGLCAQFPQLKIWAPSVAHLAPASRIRQAYGGPVWGRAMYEILRASKITLNHHGTIQPFAGNQRLFEATGVGTMLFTEWMPDLRELFAPGQEVFAYKNLDECAQGIHYYLTHEDAREQIAHAGRARTWRDHTYAQRAQELAEIIRKHL